MQSPACAASATPEVKCSCGLASSLQLQATSKIDEYARGMISGSGSTLFEELGLYYIGPVDGHKMSDLVDVLQGAQTAPSVSASQEYGSVVSGVCSHDELPAVQLTLSVNRNCDCHPLLSNDCTTCQLCWKAA